MRPAAGAGSWTATPCLVLVYLFLPIFVIILYSFNKPAGKFNFVWKSFSLDAWRNPFALRGAGTSR